jgi:hypothetical protein
VGRRLEAEVKAVEVSDPECIALLPLSCCPGVLVLADLSSPGNFGMFIVPSADEKQEDFADLYISDAHAKRVAELEKGKEPRDWVVGAIVHSPAASNERFYVSVRLQDPPVLAVFRTIKWWRHEEVRSDHAESTRIIWERITSEARKRAEKAFKSKAPFDEEESLVAAVYFRAKE